MPIEDQGAGLDRYRIIPRVLIFIFNHGDVLLLKGAPNKRLWANKYNGIGGHIERGESVLAAARRELKEESGLAEVRLDMCGTVMVDAGAETGIGIFIFKGEVDSRTVMPSLEGALEWVNLDRVTALPLVEDLYTILPRVSQWKPGNGLISAHYSYDENQQLQINLTG